MGMVVGGCKSSGLLLYPNNGLPNSRVVRAQRGAIELAQNINVRISMSDDAQLPRKTHFVFSSVHCYVPSQHN